MGREIFLSTRKKYINSSGNNKRLFVQIKKQLLKGREFPVQINEGKIMGQLQINGNCCSLGSHYLGCIGGKFLNNQSVSTDHSNLLSYIKECREITRCKSKEELKQFVANIFDSSLVGMSKNNKTIMDYRLPIIKSVSQINETNNKVCRKGIAIAYGISVKSLQAYSIAKRCNTLGKFLHNTRRFSDSTAHDLNFAEVASVFQKNITDHSSQGKLCPHIDSYS
jgi:hypothetical protein